MFNHKDKIITPMCSSVIYLYTCLGCNSQYVGSTIRQLQCRISEHKGLSVRTKLPLSSPNYSSIREHSQNTNHNITDNQFKILTATNKIDIRILESLYIHKMKPKLNHNTPYDLNIAN